MVSLGNLLALSAQVACIAAAAEAIDAIVRLRAPAVRYAFWRVVFAICLALPWVQTPISAPQPVVSSASITVSSSPIATGAVAAPTFQVDWTWWLMVLIGAVICLRVVWIAIGCIKLGRLRSLGEPAAAVEHEQLQAALRTRADVRYVQSVKQPVTFGVIRPVVLLPHALRERPLAIRQAVIAHELVHVRRRDWCWQLGEELVLAACWFHPAIWWITSRIQLAREEVVDSLAVGITGCRREYVQALLAFADEVPFAPAPAFARRRHLFRRIVLLSTEEVMSARRIIVSAVVLLLVVAGASSTSIRAFPLRVADGMLFSSQQWRVATLERGPGPIELSAKPIGPDNPIPRKIHGEPPAFPASTSGESMSATVTLRTVVNEAGQVAELRLGGFSFRSGGISAAIDGGPDAGRQFQQLTSGAQFRDRGGAPVTAASMRSAFETFIESAAAAVQQSQFEPPRDGPIVFNTVVQFTHGKPTTSHTTAGAISTQKNGALRVGGAVGPPVKIKDVKPVYPIDAKEAQIQGVIIAELTIGADGTVTDARILRSIPELDDAALAAVKQWEFQPTYLNGQAVPVTMTVTVQFRLQ